MTNIDRRALYQTLRLNWQNDPTLSVEPWQVEDYRHLGLEALFQRLMLQEIGLDKPSFLNAAEEIDTPEELTELLLKGKKIDKTAHDQVYLIIFELWRRLVPEKPSLSIFCDELDHQISLYDNGLMDNPEPIEDLLSNLQVILEEHIDEGGDPVELFETISHSCAHDLESFLYDFIAEQIDAGNVLYASELLEAFSEYTTDVKWFDFLKAQSLASSDPAASYALVQQLIKEASKKKDLEFNLAILTFLISAGDLRDFIMLAKKTAPLLVSEEDFQDLLSICIDFYHRLDDESGEQEIQKILTDRSGKDLIKKIDPKDPDIAKLFKTMKILV